MCRSRRQGACKRLDEKAAQNENGKLYKHEGIYVSNRPVIGREKEGVKAYAMLVQKPIPTFAINPVPIFKVYRPATGLGQAVSYREFIGDGATPRFKPVDADDATKGWMRLFNDSLTICSHGPNCKHGSLCTVGRRVEYKVEGRRPPPSDCAARRRSSSSARSRPTSSSALLFPLSAPLSSSSRCFSCACESRLSASSSA